MLQVGTKLQVKQTSTFYLPLTKLKDAAQFALPAQDQVVIAHNAQRAFIIHNKLMGQLQQLLVQPNVPLVTTPMLRISV